MTSHDFHGVSNHWALVCLFNRLFRLTTTTKKNQSSGGFTVRWIPLTKGLVIRKMVYHDGQAEVETAKMYGSHKRETMTGLLLSGVPDFFDRNKILSGYDLSHYQVPHCIRVFFYFVWFVFIHHNFQFYFKLCTYCNILDIYLS